MPVPGENPELDAESRVSTLVGVSVAFASLSTLIVALRLYTRYFVVRSPGADDITIALAQVLSIGLSIVTILQAKYALGRHVWMAAPEDGISQLKCLLAAMLIYNLAQIITKCSFLFQYCRIFDSGGGRTRTVCLYLLVSLALWGIAQSVLVAFACVPTSLFIPSQVPVCLDSLSIFYLTSIMNIITDFIIFSVPLPAIRGLHLPRRQKILVTSIFCLGFFTCIISIVRLFTLRAAANTTDPTWDNVASAWLSVLELNCGIICASLPPLRALLRHWGVPGLGSGRGRSDGYLPERSDGDGSFSKPAGSAKHIDAPGAAGKVYPLRTFASTGMGVTASQEELNRDLTNNPSGDSVYRGPEFANRHPGRQKSSRLTNKIRGGEGNSRRVDAGDFDVELESGIRVTREIGFEKEGSRSPPKKGRR
ncbi:hypothetical protein QBC34DRAFT_188086 [Podospora aff. communis PSN243]|uniref:Rhodopsin domain-containing protein n=1 Tax=Podospora aff. communis PSN243 TaxID=3040156 RepID=A0AAV9G8J9_9PEZI|nr:hypothetical protein QBC34DRAFT_188086 [Podospora aff. communis PSN243]